MGVALLARTRLFGECRGEAGRGRLAEGMDGPADALNAVSSCMTGAVVAFDPRRVIRASWARWAGEGGFVMESTEVVTGRKGDVEVGGGVRESVDMVLCCTTLSKDVCG